MSDESSHKTIMGLSPFSIDDERPSVKDDTAADEPVETPAAATKPTPTFDPVASHIAAKRKELALKTQRLNLDELDWDIPPDKLPRATPGPAGSTPAWDESELEEEIARDAAAREAAAEAAGSSAAATPTAAEAASTPLGEEGAGTLLFSADTMNKLRAAAEAQTLKPTSLPAPASPSDPVPAQAGLDETPDLALPPPPVSGDAPVVSGASSASGTLIMSAGAVNAAAAAAGIAVSDLQERTGSGAGSSYASKGGRTESTSMPSRKAGSAVEAADTGAGSGQQATPVPAPETAAPVPSGSQQELAPGSALPMVDEEIANARPFPLAAVIVGATVLLIVVAVALFFLTS